MSSDAVPSLDRPAPGPSPAPEVSIEVVGVGKRYLLYDRPQDRLKEQLLWRFGRTFGREFWALRDVSLDVRRGEAVGIIGANGSGKSTLLQIVAGTLRPTTGRVRVHGRVAALLELGTGFNPEFTGRENVYLNGAILGIGQAEMAERFDDIAAFADIGEFIDQPVKLYSSGMLVRLAFAVQAHVEADLLIVDEALAVGDVYFQHRCMRRIRRLLDGGTTLLFVSHASETVKRFCRRGLWLDAGCVRYFGDAGVAVERYLAATRMREVGAGEAAPPDTAEERPVEVTASPLARVAGEIDLTREAFFLRGSWPWADVAGVAHLARATADRAALAGFRGAGTHLELIFLRGQRASNVQVTIDGRARLVELSAPGPERVDVKRFDLPAGEHTVLLAPIAPPGDAATLWWLGGRLLTPAALPFRRDPRLGATESEVARYGTGKARLTAVELLDYATERPVGDVYLGQRVRLRLHAERLAPIGPRAEFSFIVRDRNRIDLFGTTSIEENVRVDPAAARFVAEFAFEVRLAAGSYSILAAFVECSEDLTVRVPLDQIDIATMMTVAGDVDRPVWYVYHEPMAVTACVYSDEEPTGG